MDRWKTLPASVQLVGTVSSAAASAPEDQDQPFPPTAIGIPGAFVSTNLPASAIANRLVLIRVCGVLVRSIPTIVYQLEDQG
ncbi:hypothetical protein ZHAS_00009712 [Anopheles sinensis]|uniref:Uncharacterized protein n=1 Tax=Anopheles sinensis TaxID=74873 RepID=A0A084VV03_ANOSI|nr:hypothetical protein ZHAS_00009712 [Anopheles sinensis]